VSAITSIGLKAYGSNLNLQNKISSSKNEQVDSFVQTLENSLKSVNDLQLKKEQMVKEFAAGKEQNVHELMITLQKASMTMQMTTAVRNKVLEAYREIMRLTF